MIRTGNEQPIISSSASNPLFLCLRVFVLRYTQYEIRTWCREGDSSPLSLSLVLRSPADLAVIRFAHSSSPGGAQFGFKSPLVLRGVWVYEIRTTRYEIRTWCREGDLNPQGLKVHMALNHARLPLPPSRQELRYSPFEKRSISSSSPITSSISPSSITSSE